jgi:hypothetical protein
MHSRFPTPRAHFRTLFVPGRAQTEQDFIQIAGAGLNWIRLPIPFWAIETWEGEPFLERVCWTYILRALGWARKYGLRVYLDLHTVPGSQNGAPLPLPAHGATTGVADGDGTQVTTTRARTARSTL